MTLSRRGPQPVTKPKKPNKSTTIAAGGRVSSMSAIGTSLSQYATVGTGWRLGERWRITERCRLRQGGERRQQLLEVFVDRTRTIRRIVGDGATQDRLQSTPFLILAGETESVTLDR